MTHLCGKRRFLHAGAFLLTLCLATVGPKLAAGAELIADDRSVCNAAAIEELLLSQPRAVVHLPAGEFTLKRPFDTALLSRLKTFALIGARPERHWQLLESTKDRSRGGTTLRWESATGEILFRVVTPLGSNVVYGPYQWQNLCVVSTGGGAHLEIGNRDDLSKPGGNTRGCSIDSCVFSALDQQWSRGAELLYGPHQAIDRSRPQVPLIYFHKPYDLDIACTIRGGWCALQLHNADNPQIGRLHTGLCGWGLKITSQGTGSVPGSIRGWFSEGCAVGNYLDTGMLTSCRLENGYQQTSPGWHATPCDWMVAKGGSKILLANLPVDSETDPDNPRQLTADDLFEPLCPLRLPGWDYPFLVTRVVDTAPGSGYLEFDLAGQQCYLNRNAQGSGLDRAFGFNFVLRGPRTSMQGCSIGFNQLYPGLPVGFYLPTSQRSVFSGLQAGIGNFDTNNRLAIVGHCAGPAHYLGAGVDWYGGSTNFAPDHPLADRFGRSDRNSSSSGLAIGPPLSEPGRRWEFGPGDGLRSTNQQGLLIEFRRDELGRSIEDWSQSTSGRYLHLDQIEIGPATKVSYRVLLRKSDAAAEAAVSFRVRNLTGTLRTPFVMHEVAADWQWIEGEIDVAGLAGETDINAQVGGAALQFRRAVVEVE